MFPARRTDEAFGHPGKREAAHAPRIGCSWSFFLLSHARNCLACCQQHVAAVVDTITVSTCWVRRRILSASTEGTRMTRAAAIARAQAYFDSGAFKDDLSRRVAIPTESQNPERAADLARYLASEMVPALEKLGFKTRTLTQARAKGPFLFAERL